LDRYIQQQASPANRAIWDYHFFNTYFYNKLKEAVAYKVVVSLGFLTFHKSNYCFQLFDAVDLLQLGVANA
jgi:hypothetical protein